MNCKLCGSSEVVKYGSYKGVPRYFCKSCKRKFKDDSTLFHAKVSPEQIEAAKDLKKQGLTLRAIQGELKKRFNHSYSTSTISQWVASKVSKLAL